MRGDSMMPRWANALVSRYRMAKYSARVCLELRGSATRHCPICGYEGRFQAYGLPPRFDARCPHCASLERHRLLFLGDKDMNLFERQADVLHFAPEPAVTGFVANKVKSYRSADLRPGEADVALNIEDIALPDSSVDVVIASHVLEHVNDKLALQEMRRILRRDGRAIIMIPIVEGWESTYENAAVVTERDRVLHFGQHDHVRSYGRDVRDRIRAAGFDLEEFVASADDCIQYGLQRGERVFVATKR